LSSLVVAARPGFGCRYPTPLKRLITPKVLTVRSVDYDWDDLSARSMPPHAPARPLAEQLIEIMVERFKAQFQPQKIVLLARSR